MHVVIEDTAALLARVADMFTAVSADTIATDVSGFLLLIKTHSVLERGVAALTTQAGVLIQNIGMVVTL